MSAKVFISYASVDEKRAKQLAKALSEINVEYFLDRKDIEWGDDVTERITRGLSDCSALIVVVSPASLKSQWVLFEVGHASGLGKKILPFLTHPSLDVPAFLKPFHYKTCLSDVKDYFKNLFATTPERKKPSSPSEGDVSPQQRDEIRAERNQMLTERLKREEGIRDCSVFQIDDHTDNGYVAFVQFDPDTTSVGAVLSTTRKALDELFPDIPVWGEMQAETEDSIGFAFTYIDKYNKTFL